MADPSKPIQPAPAGGKPLEIKLDLAPGWSFAETSASGPLSIENVGAASLVSETPNTAAITSFETLSARIAGLEAVLNSIQTSSPGPGHNLQLVTADQFVEIARFVERTNQQQNATTVIDRQELTEAVEKNNRVAEKIKELLDIFAKEAAKTLGGQIGKQLGNIHIWYGLYGALILATEAARAWLATIPH